MEMAVEEKLDFLFSVTVHLGTTTNNYAEYVGVMLAEIFGALMRLETLTIKCDS